MLSKTTIHDAISAIDQYMIDNGYSDSTRYNFKHCYADVIARFYQDHGQTHYSEELSHSLLLIYDVKTQGSASAERTYRGIRRCLFLIREYTETGIIPRRGVTHRNIHYPSEGYMFVLERYVENKIAHGYSEKTMSVYRSCIRQFLSFLESSGCETLSVVRQENILSYIPLLAQKWNSTLNEPLCMLRSFLRYAFEEGSTKQNFSVLLDAKAADRSVVKAGFTSKEIHKMLDSIDRSTSLGLRNYAMITLAVHTGIRSIDILNLKLHDIDWRRAEIRFIQHKTGRDLVLPLDQKTGDAIAEYILNGRPESTSDYVFLRTKAPFQHLKLGSSIGSRMVQKYAAIAGVSWTKAERKGFHSFRRSVGSQLLQAEIPLYAIQEILGHAHMDSTRPYLSTDKVHLKECAIPMHTFPCQKEGLSHDVQQ